jgi:hypothetical protein
LSTRSVHTACSQYVVKVFDETNRLNASSQILSARNKLKINKFWKQNVFKSTITKKQAMSPFNPLSMILLVHGEALSITLKCTIGIFKKDKGIF